MQKDKKLKKDKQEKRDLRSSFLRLFGKYDVRNEQQFIYFGKWLIFLVLVFVEALILLQNLYSAIKGGAWAMLVIVLALETVLTLSQALKLFAVKNKKTHTKPAWELCGFTVRGKANWQAIYPTEYRFP